MISHLSLEQQVKSDQSSYREWNFDQPPLDLPVNQNEPEYKKAPAPGGLDLDTYQFPHLYQEISPGGRYAEIQLKRQLSFSRWIEGEGDVSRLLPGFAFTLFEHPRGDVNAQWWLTEMHHFGEQPQVLEHEAPDRGFMYQSRFTAIPFETRFVPEIRHPKKRVEGLQSAIVTGPESEEVYVDKYGRVKVHFHWDRLGPMTEKSSCWVRVADGWAGHNFGFIQAPRIGQEVIVEFMEGDPDRPVITGRVYNAEKMPPWELPSQNVLSGIQSREFKGGQRNQMVFDDTQGQVQTQISSDHQLSQLNLGYITRINHVDGRDDFRGEGFELRTDGWGTIRAAKGLYITTEERLEAASHHKSMNETSTNLKMAAKLHHEIGELAVGHMAQERYDQSRPVSMSLKKQATAVTGDGQHKELNQPHLLLSSPVGIAATTPGSSHWHTDDHTAITSCGSTSIASAKSFLASALEKISLFAHQKGLKIFAGKGDIKIQAQQNDLEAVAEEQVRIFSNNNTVHISSPTEVLLTAGGSYIRIDKNGIEHGTLGDFVSKAATHSFIGPAECPYLEAEMPWLEPPGMASTVLRDPLWRPLDLMENVDEGSDIENLNTGSSVSLKHSKSQEHEEYTMNGRAEGSKYTQMRGNKFTLSDDTEDN